MKTNIPKTVQIAVKLSALLSLGTLPGYLGAATIAVTNTADSGPGTLRAALAGANDGDTINFTLSTPAKITLTSGELLVSKSVAIIGPGPSKLAVDGNQTSRVLHIAASNIVAIAGLTITNGRWTGYFGGDGGGILNFRSALLVSNCMVRGNVANAGGGIANSGELGGVASLVIVNSTISDNTAGEERTGPASAIYNHGSPLGYAELRIVNCTISDNRGYSAVFNDGGSGGNALLRIVNSTLSGAPRLVDNSGQFGNATTEIGSTILAGSGPYPNLLNSVGTINSLGYNLSNDNGQPFGFRGSGGLDAVSDQLNTDPVLGPLQDNGGPTFTHALMTCSPALDQGKNFSGFATDQRGMPRSFNLPDVDNASGGDGTDVGAFEAQAHVSDTVPPTVSCPADIVTNKVFGLGGGVAIFPAPLAHDNCDPNPTVSCTSPSGSFFPAGTTTVICRAVDASGNSNQCSFHVTVLDQPSQPDWSATSPLVISPNGTNATVILDGSRSSDPDGDSLTYAWSEVDENWDTTPLATGVVAVVVMPVGYHLVDLATTDDTYTSGGDFTIEIITATEAVNRLEATLTNDVTRAQALAATMRAALASIDRSNPTSTINQLQAFQNKVRAQVSPIDPTVADSLIQSAQQIIDALTGGNTNPGGRPHVQFTSLSRTPNGRVRMQFAAASTGSHLIEASTNLVNWELIGVANQRPDGQFDYEDTQSARHAQRFYRVRSE